MFSPRYRSSGQGLYPVLSVSVVLNFLFGLGYGSIRVWSARGCNITYRQHRCRSRAHPVVSTGHALLSNK